MQVYVVRSEPLHPRERRRRVEQMTMDPRTTRTYDFSAARHDARPAGKSKPRSHIATGPCEVWSWDITYLRTAVRGSFRSAKKATPRRWTGDTRNWTPVGDVTLNPLRSAEAA